MAEESERRTRQQRVDPQLRDAGWEVVPCDPGRPLSAYARHAIEEFPTEDGPADARFCNLPYCGKTPLAV